MIAFCLIYEILAFNLPFRATWIELLFVAAGVAAETLVMSAIPRDKGTGGEGGFIRALSVFLLPFVAFTIVGRVHQAHKMAQEFDGVVYQKYSGGHAAPSIVVGQKDGSTVSMESIDRPAWDSMVAGRSRLSKPPWSAFGQVDGKPMRILPKAKVMFLGPFPD